MKERKTGRITTWIAIIILASGFLFILIIVVAPIAFRHFNRVSYMHEGRLYSLVVQNQYSKTISIYINGDKMGAISSFGQSTFDLWNAKHQEMTDPNTNTLEYYYLIEAKDSTGSSIYSKTFSRNALFSPLILSPAGDNETPVPVPLISPPIATPSK